MWEQRIRLIADSLSYPRRTLQRLFWGVNFDTAVSVQQLRDRGLLDGVGTVIDAGAYDGIFAAACACVMPQAAIWSFEPTEKTFRALQKKVGRWPRVTPVNMALGASAGMARLSTGMMGQSNSLLPMTKEHLEGWPRSARIGTEEVRVVSLDEFFAERKVEGGLYLKADVQGYELEVLRGAKRVLERVRLLQLECSFVPLFEGAPTLPEMVAGVTAGGFRLVDILEPLIPPGKKYAVSCDLLFVRA